jgi:hypothetical protein
MTANFPREIFEILMPPEKMLEIFLLMRQRKDWGYLFLFYFYPKWSKRNSTSQVVLKIHL